MTFQQHKNQDQPTFLGVKEKDLKFSNSDLISSSVCVRAPGGGGGGGGVAALYQTFVLSLKFTLTILGSII